MGSTIIELAFKYLIFYECSRFKIFSSETNILPFIISKALNSIYFFVFYIESENLHTYATNRKIEYKYEINTRTISAEIPRLINKLRIVYNK